MESGKPKGLKPKMTERKLRSGVYCQDPLRQKGLKQRLRVPVCDHS